MILLYKKSRTGKSVGRDCRGAVIRGRGEGGMESDGGYVQVSFWDDEDILELDGGNGCPTL